MLIIVLSMQAEVQSLHADGSIALHTRSTKYGKVWTWLEFNVGRPPSDSGGT